MCLGTTCATCPALSAAVAIELIDATAAAALPTDTAGTGTATAATALLLLLCEDSFRASEERLDFTSNATLRAGEMSLSDASCATSGVMSKWKSCLR